MSQSIEKWKPVLGYEGSYEVSDHGRVRSLGRHIATRWGGSRWLPGRAMRPFVSDSGYSRITLTGKGNPRKFLVHRLVLESFVEKCPRDMEACHANGVPDDNRLQNLRWDTKSANNNDRVRHGTHHHTRKTHCPQGHPLDAPNLVMGHLRNGQRSCLACARARAYSRKHQLTFTREFADEYFERILATST